MTRQRADFWPADDRLRWVIQVNARRLAIGSGNKQQRLCKTVPSNAIGRWCSRPELAADPAQALAAEKLQLLSNRLEQYTQPRLGELLYPFIRKRRGSPQGLYLFGGVGRGKTMLMDLFFESVPVEPKRRVHFQEFMSEAHEAIDRARKCASGDPVAVAAKEMAEAALLLCFDDLEVTDIADAMILGRLFQHLLAASVVIVATYGLNRPLFEPFIKLIEARMDVHELGAAHDYRLEKLQGSHLYLSPADAGAKAAMDISWLRLTGREGGEPATLVVKGRSLVVPEAAFGVARFLRPIFAKRHLGRWTISASPTPITP
jgi:cell division protein ZapE